MYIPRECSCGRSEQKQRPVSKKHMRNLFRDLESRRRVLAKHGLEENCTHLGKVKAERQLAKILGEINQEMIPYLDHWEMGAPDVAYAHGPLPEAAGAIPIREDQ